MVIIVALKLAMSSHVRFFLRQKKTRTLFSASPIMAQQENEEPKKVLEHTAASSFFFFFSIEYSENCYSYCYCFIVYYI